jgi:hypothetical protein
VRAFSRRQAVIVVALPVSCGLLATPARSQQEPVRLVYQAYAACPGEPSFVREVEAHGEHQHFLVDDQSSRAFLVTVSPDGKGSRGLLQITGVDGAVSRREVSGQTCAEVVSALAFMTALAIDPQAAATTPEPGPASIAGTDGGKTDTLVASSAAPTSAGPPPKLPPTPPASPTPTPPDVDRPLPSPSAPASHPWSLGLGVVGQMSAGFAPDLAAGGGLFAELSGTGVGSLVPSFRVSLLAASTQPSFADGIGAQLTWFTARVEACPARLDVATLVATACVWVDAGLLHSQGMGLANTEAESKPWIVPGALGRVSWPSYGDVWLELDGGIGLPLERYTFSYQQAGAAAPTELARGGAVGGELGLGAGYRLP